MALKRLEEFRLYYNQTIQPELLRMERERLRMVVFHGGFAVADRRSYYFGIVY
jgi:hypothetical protein